jgi:hypothetical protein
MFLTYSFEYKHPNIDEQSEEAEELLARHRNTAKMAVEKTIETIRRMVQAGQLKAD